MALLIFTVGTRDVQLNKNNLPPGFSFQLRSRENGTQYRALMKDAEEWMNVNAIQAFPGMYALLNPRSSGAVLLERDFPIDMLYFPILEAALSWEIPFTEIVVVATNQPDEVHERYRGNDTLYFAELIKKKVERLNAAIKVRIVNLGKDLGKLEVLYQQVADELQLSSHLGSKDKVYLLSQGGIDQVNQALSLQLIRQFRERLVLLQKPEQEPMRESYFPALFIRDLDRERLLSALGQFDFGRATDFLPADSEAWQLARFAQLRLELKATETQFPEFCKRWNLDDSSWQRMQSLALGARICFNKQDYSGMLWRLFSVLEALYKERLEVSLPGLQKSKIPNDWFEPVSRVGGLLEAIMKKEILIEKPNRKALKFIFDFLVEQKQLQLLAPDSEKKASQLNALFNQLERLSGLRNAIFHGIASIELRDITQALKGISVEQLLRTMDGYLGLKELDYLDEVCTAILLESNKGTRTRNF